MARQRSHRQRRRRRGRFGGLYRILSILAVAAAVIVACVVFFRVNRVTVEGNVRYTPEEVMEASGIELGDNLIALSKGRVAGAIRTRLPYVESVSIRRQLPDGVVLTVKERRAAASVEGTGARWLISSQGKILEEAQGHSVMAIRGLKAVAPYAGGMIQVAEEDGGTLNHVLALLTALEEREMLADCTALDCTAATYLTLEWKIYTVKFPRGGDYPYMLRLIDAALAHEKMPQDEPGIFDLTVEENAVHFRRSR